MYVSACVCLYLYPCIALGFTSCILWPIIPGFYCSICTAMALNTKHWKSWGIWSRWSMWMASWCLAPRLPSLMRLLGSVPTKKNSFLVHNLCIRLGANRKNMDWLTLIRGYRGTLSWAMPFCGPATFSKLRFENSWEKAAWPKFDILGSKWVWINTYRYIFSGMNIHLPAILMFTRGTRFWHTAKWVYRRFTLSTG